MLNTEFVDTNLVEAIANMSFAFLRIAMSFCAAFARWAVDPGAVRGSAFFLNANFAKTWTISLFAIHGITVSSRAGLVRCTDYAQATAVYAGAFGAYKLVKTFMVWTVPGKTLAFK